MQFSASAPTKVILFGEHYVVYGAPALSVAVDKRRIVELEEISGEERVEIINPVYKEEGVIFPDGSAEGHMFLNALAAVYKRVYQNSEELKGRAFKATLVGDRIFKGMGASSAIFASFAKCLYTAAGREANDEEIFMCAQAGDEIDHGGRPSGVDARTVVHGGMIKFWREFNPDKFNFEKMKIILPKDTAILIVDTYKGERCNTGDMVLLFAKKHGITKKPGELIQEERNRVIEPYMKIYENALGELNENGDAKKLGELMNINHELLKNAGLSTDAIEEAVNIILENGGLGAKITGAGGVGGALIGYAWKDDLKRIKEELMKKGFESIELNTTNTGVKKE